MERHYEIRLLRSDVLESLQTFLLKKKERYKADIRATNILLQGIPKTFYKSSTITLTPKTFRTNMKMISGSSRMTSGVQVVEVRYNANNQGRPFQRNNARGNVRARNAGGQNKDGNRPQDSDYFKDKMLLMNAHENGVVLDEEQLLFLTGEHATNFDDDVDDLALNMDHVFEVINAYAIRLDVDEGSHHTDYVSW
ncbi:hypothetical protein Tco_0471739 [Tanacetum coccineum]